MSSLRSRGQLDIAYKCEQPLKFLESTGYYLSLSRTRNYQSLGLKFTLTFVNFRGQGQEITETIAVQLKTQISYKVVKTGTYTYFSLTILLKVRVYLKFVCTLLRRGLVQACCPILCQNKMHVQRKSVTFSYHRHE